jgi:hypothetical protein
MINKHEIRVYGIRRSGNHAIISWIFQHFGETVVHLNDIKIARNIDPYKSFSQVLIIRNELLEMQTQNNQFFEV